MTIFARSFEIDPSSSARQRIGLQYYPAPPKTPPGAIVQAHRANQKELESYPNYRQPGSRRNQG